MKNIFIKDVNDTQRAPYEVPAVVYEGLISTRAGTPEGVSPNNSEAGVGTDDLFDN